MTETRTEISRKAVRKRRTTAFKNRLWDELHKLMRESQHTKWLEDVFKTNPFDYMHPIYDVCIAKYIEELYDKHLKEKYGDRDVIGDPEEFLFSKRSMIRDVIENLAQCIHTCKKSKINWEQFKAEYENGR